MMKLEYFILYKNVADRRSGYTMRKAYLTGLYGGGSFKRI